MAHKTISDEEMTQKSLELFRAYGFEGVSLKQLADAMGLEKASLYYRFPGGKDQIALEMARSVGVMVRELILTPLIQRGTSPRRRVQLACERFRDFYAGGTKSCTLDLLSIPGTPPKVRETLRAVMHAWLDAFAEVAKESGLSAVQARTRAEEAILRIEGALVISRVLGNTASFDRVLKGLPELLTTV